MEFLTVFNRSSKTLKGVWDGRHYDLAPGPAQYPAIQALKFKEQNPLMGSENPHTLERQYLIAIVEQGDDTSPLEQSTAVEKWDRAAMANAGDIVIIKGNGQYRPTFEAPLPLGNDSSFVVPGTK